MQSPLFTGVASLREPYERLAFWLTLLFAFPAAAAIGFFIHESVGISQVALFIVISMLYITLARGRLLGSSVRIHAAQHPRIFAIVKRACAALEIPTPLIFAREDAFVPVAALGFGEPYSLVISSHWIDEFKDDELAFMIGRELGHIAAGHTRYLSLLSVSGNENPVIALIFGAWLRRCDLTCDRVGLLVCGSLDAAMRAIAISAFHHFGKEVDLEQLAEQGREIQNDAVLRWGEWLGATPYATRRIASMRGYMATHAYALSEEWFLREVTAEPPTAPAPGTTRVVNADCAGWWRRSWAFAIDCILVLAIFGALAPTISNRNKEVSILGSSVPQTHARATSMKLRLKDGPITSDEINALTSQMIQSSSVMRAVVSTLDNSKYALLIALYMALLVATAGQSFGMMIAGLRVVTIDYHRPGVIRTIRRYVFIAFWPLGAIVFSLSPFTRRVMLHDRLTGTRLITSERVMARILSPQ